MEKKPLEREEEVVLEGNHMFCLQERGDPIGMLQILPNFPCTAQKTRGHNTLLVRPVCVPLTLFTPTRLCMYNVHMELLVLYDDFFSLHADVSKTSASKILSYTPFPEQLLRRS